jgi:RND family efflux transporter MFP subunit
MNKTLRYGLIALALLAVFGSGALILGHKPAGNNESKAESNPVMAVTLVKPELQNWPQTLQANGPIAAWQEGIVSAETGGLRIMALHADVGDVVKRGQLLAELAQDSVNADLRKYEAALASARASLAQARADAERARLVKGSGAISEQQISSYLISEQTAQANVDSAQAQLDAQRVILTRTRVTAVDDGVISSRSATLGKVVSSGEELYRLVRQNRFEWRAELDAQQLPRVHPGQQALITTPGGEQIRGKVRIAAPTLATDTSRALVYVSLPVGSSARAGMYASGSIELGEQPALSVPQSTVVLRDGFSYAFELGPDMHVTRRKLSIGRRQADRVEVLAGLSPQAQLVANGAAFLADGDLVSVSNTAKEKP